MELIPQTPEMVKKDWDFFVEAIEATATKAQQDYTPQGVYLAVKDYEVTVFHVYQDGERRGLLVLTDHTDLYTSKAVLHVDILYLTGPSLIQDMHDSLSAMVDEHGFDQIEFRSPRKGWFKYLSNAGFKACTTFSKEF
tara:strand:- start:317 stop:730 length:414 start_codon:yes stop_codon:yes gene_type:complete